MKKVIMKNKWCRGEREGRQRKKGRKNKRREKEIIEREKKCTWKEIKKGGKWAWKKVKRKCIRKEGKNHVSNWRHHPRWQRKHQGEKKRRLFSSFSTVIHFKAQWRHDMWVSQCPSGLWCSGPSVVSLTQSSGSKNNSEHPGTCALPIRWQQRTWWVQLSHSRSGPAPCSCSLPPDPLNRRSGHTPPSLLLCRTSTTTSRSLIVRWFEINLPSISFKEEAAEVNHWRSRSQLWPRLLWVSALSTQTTAGTRCPFCRKDDGQAPERQGQPEARRQLYKKWNHWAGSSCGGE